MFRTFAGFLYPIALTPLLFMAQACGGMIMELAGHTDLQTTQRYMHLSLAMKDSAIRLLEQPIPEGAAA